MLGVSYCRQYSTSFLCLWSVSIRRPKWVGTAKALSLGRLLQSHLVRGIASLRPKTCRPTRQRQKEQILQEDQQRVKPFLHPPFCSQITVTNTVAYNSHWSLPYAEEWHPILTGYDFQANSSAVPSRSLSGQHPLETLHAVCGRTSRYPVMPSLPYSSAVK